MVLWIHAKPLIMAILAILAIMAWTFMALDMVDIDVYAKNWKNLDQQWKGSFKICIDWKVMTKTNTTMKFWSISSFLPKIDQL